jgi:hypothetical protein
MSGSLKLESRKAGFKLGDGYEYNKPVKDVFRLLGNDCMAQALIPIGLTASFVLFSV